MKINNLIGTNVQVAGPSLFVFPLGTTEANLALGNYAVGTVVSPNALPVITAVVSTNVATASNGVCAVTVVNNSGSAFYLQQNNPQLPSWAVGSDITTYKQPEGYSLLCPDTVPNWFSANLVILPPNSDGTLPAVWQNTSATYSTNLSTNYVAQTNASLTPLYTFNLDKEYDALDLTSAEALAYQTGYMRSEDRAAFEVGFDLGLWICGVYLGTKIVFEILKEKTIGTAD